MRAMCAIFSTDIASVFCLRGYLNQRIFPLILSYCSSVIQLRSLFSCVSVVPQTQNVQENNARNENCFYEVNSAGQMSSFICLSFFPSCWFIVLILYSDFFCNVCFLRKEIKMYLDFKDKDDPIRSVLLTLECVGGSGPLFCTISSLSFCSPRVYYIRRS